VALLVTAVLAVVTAPTPLAVASAALATIGLARDRRLGPLGAAVLVALGIPWGRGADTLTFEIAGLPLRPHDAVIAVGMLGALPVLWRRRPRPSLMLGLVVALLVLGLSALAVGLIEGHPLRDVFRDVRWWAFYGAALLALFGATSRDRIIRGVLLGMTGFALLVVIAALLPAFPGGVKDQELLYDRGTLRMQFGNSAFLLPAIAYVAARVVERRGLRDAAWLVLLLSAVVLSLTRTSIVAAIGVLGLVFLAYLIDRWSRPGFWRGSLASGALLASLALGSLVIGVAVDIAGTPPPSQVATNDGTAPEQPLDRILFQEERSDLGSVAGGGRFPSYRAAAAVILEHPLLGAGLGSLTDVGYAYSEARADTIGRAPGVDNAYLTVGLKAGIPGMLVFAALVALTGWLAFRRGGAMRRWFVPAWLGLIVLTMTQAFAGSLYGPFVFALLLVLPALTRGSSVPRPARPDPART
jgi:O-antigen ligase